MSPKNFNGGRYIISAESFLMRSENFLILSCQRIGYREVECEYDSHAGDSQDSTTLGES